jgi:hypothetical protein
MRRDGGAHCGQTATTETNGITTRAPRTLGEQRRDVAEVYTALIGGGQRRAARRLRESCIVLLGL